MNLRFFATLTALALLSCGCSGPGQGSAVTPRLTTQSPPHHPKRDAACTTITDSTGATYTAARLGGGDHIDVEYSNTPCQIGIYINGFNGPNTLDHTMVDGVFSIGIYFDNAGNAHEDHTQICVNGSNANGACNTGTGSSPGTGLNVRNTPKLAIDHTSIDGYAAGYATNACPNTANQLGADHTTITNATYPWSYQGGKNSFNFSPGHDSPMFNGSSCAGSSIGAGPASLLFVSNLGLDPFVLGYAPPWNDSSSPSLRITNGVGTFNYGLATDSAGNLYLAGISPPISQVAIYSAPLSNSSAPSAQISDGVGTPMGVALDAGGKLYVANAAGPSVTVYAPPFTNSSSPSATITDGLVHPTAVALDSSGNLYVADTSTDNVQVYAPPFSSSSTPIATISVSANPLCVAFDSSGRLFVCEITGGSGGYGGFVAIFNPPFSNSSSPSVTMNVDAPSSVAFDGAGNLYAVAGNTQVNVYEPPFSASSTPIATIRSGLEEPYGVAISGTGAGTGFTKHRERHLK